MMKLLASALCMLACFMPLAAMGQVLSDPTRPPQEANDGAISRPGASTKQRGLQSVIISSTHCAAIIDGKTVALGENHGNEKLVEINERGVVLQGKSGSRYLALFPAVGMKINEAIPPSKQAYKCQQGMPLQEQTPDRIAGQKEKK